jgi:hypothetical protein
MPIAIILLLCEEMKMLKKSCVFYQRARIGSAFALLLLLFKRPFDSS